MRGLRKSGAILLLAFFICCGITRITGHAAGIQPYWDNAKAVETQLIISGNTAKSSLMIDGKPGTSKITGTLKLVDNSAGTTVDEWTISVNAASCSEVKRSTVTAGHKFTLSFSGYVYDANGRGEYVSASSSN